MSDQSTPLQAIFNRIETGRRLSQRDLQMLVAAVRSQQVTIATGDRAVAIGGNADGAVIVTGDRNIVIRADDVAAIRRLTEKRPRSEELLLQTVKDEVASRLRQSLHNAILIKLGMDAQPEQVKRPWDSDIKIGSKPIETIPEDWNTLRVFDEVQGKLLILGAPGSGKTSMMLELTQSLCNRAEQIAGFPLPVILNLSTWKQDKQLLRDWLILELQSKYGVRKDVSRKWLRDAKLLPMLDGLDELESSRQEACVRAINQFLQSEERSQYLIVCSRLEEYSNYETCLHLNGAIYLRELREYQIQDYLVANNHVALWETIKGDNYLLELVRAPLLLAITTLAYEGLSLDQWQQLDSIEARLQYLLNTYINRMLTRHTKDELSIEKLSTAKQIKNWLIWLAQQLQNQFQTEFLIEKIQPTLLKSNQQRWFYFASTKIIIGLFLGLGYFLYPNGYFLGFGLSVPSILIWIIFSSSYEINDKMGKDLIAGFTVLVIFLLGINEHKFSMEWLLLVLFSVWLCGSKLVNSSFGEIEPVEKLKLSFKNARREFFLSLAGGLSAGLIVGGFFGLFLGLLSGVGSGLFFLLAFGLTGRMIDSDLKATSTPNQGIKNSARNAIAFTVFLGLISGLAIAFIFVPGILEATSEWKNLNLALQIKLDPSKYEKIINSLYRHQETMPWAKDILELSQTSTSYLALQIVLTILKIAYPLIIAATFSVGIVGGLTHGGITCIRHFILRSILHVNRYIPWNYVRFLDYCTDRLLLQRVGGRYRFIHRLLQEHFAAMPLEK